MRMADSVDRFGGFDGDMVVFVGGFGFAAIAGDADGTAAAAGVVVVVLANDSRNGNGVLLAPNNVCL